MTNPTREQIKAALKDADNVGKFPAPPPWDSLRTLGAAYRATQRPAQIIGRVIAAAIGVFALAGLLAVVKVLVGVVG